MVAGQDRYYQIVRCLRDEQPRADRSFEFTQLDVEMSFVDEEDVFAVIEPLYARIVREIQGVEVPTPFPRMTYDEMMDRYGSDKPDLRYGMELADVGEVFAGTGFRAFASVLDSDGAHQGVRGTRRRAAVPQGARRAGAGREVARRGRRSCGSRSRTTGSVHRSRSTCRPRRSTACAGPPAPDPAT